MHLHPYRDGHLLIISDDGHPAFMFPLATINSVSSAAPNSEVGTLITVTIGDYVVAHLPEQDANVLWAGIWRVLNEYWAERARVQDGNR